MTSKIIILQVCKSTLFANIALKNLKPKTINNTIPVDFAQKIVYLGKSKWMCKWKSFDGTKWIFFDVCYTLVDKTVVYDNSLKEMLVDASLDIDEVR